MTAVCEVGAARRLLSMRRLIRPAVGRDSLLVQIETDASPSSLTVKFFPARRWAGLLINGLESDRHPHRLCPPYAVACGRATAARQSVSAGAGVPPTERTRARERAHTDRPLVAVSPISSPYRIVIRSIAVLWTAVLPIRRAYR